MIVPSLLVCVGKLHYKLHEVVDEYLAIGVCKRIPLTGIVSGLEKGISKIFVAVPDAIIKVTAEGKTLFDLAYALLEAGVLTEDKWMELVDLQKPYWTGEELQANDFVPEHMLYISYAYSKLKPKAQAELKESLGLVFCMGIIGYAPFSGYQVVLNDGENDLPEDLEDLRPLVENGYVHPVHVRYKDETKDQS